MIRKTELALAVAGLLASCHISPLAAQNAPSATKIKIPVRPGEPEVPSTIPKTPSETSLPKAAGTPEEQITQQRLAKLKALKFDRRPSTILKAWANLPESPEAKSDEEPSEKQIDPVKEAIRAFEMELTTLQRNVTLGNWSAVDAFLKNLEEDDAKAGYSQLLTSMQKSPQKGTSTQLSAYAEKNELSVDDVFALIGLAPVELDEKMIASIGGIMRMSLTAGNDLEQFIRQFHEVASAADSGLKSLEVAGLLISAGQAIRAGAFLPEPELAIEKSDYDALNLLVQYFLALHQKESKTEHLEQAWQITQSTLAANDIDDKQKQEALKRAVSLAPKVREELGQTWLDESFTTNPERGMEILATIGSAVSQGLVLRAQDPSQRGRELELQHSAVNALLNAAPEQANEWNSTLDLLARNWLREASHSRRYDSSTSASPTLQRDIYGNLFYSSSRTSSSSQRSRTPRAVPTGVLLESRPDGKWLELVDPSMKPELSGLMANLYLKVNEEDKAFPYIEQLAETHPEVATKIAEEFLTVWTKNHDPNNKNRRSSVYMFSYGFNRRAQGIPLTRSKQDRNLKELSKWLKRLRALPIKKLDEDLITKAFTNTHGEAEVYRLETIESVFGSLTELDPMTLAELIQKMRQNLASVWRIPATQKRSGTNRKEKDIEAEVKRGYQVARKVLDRAIESRPEHWAMQLAKAAINHDENEYRNELEQSSEFTDRRDRALTEFHKAAEMYAARVSELTEDKETAKPFEVWFYASLGACDIGKLNEAKQPRLQEAKLIREAINALPEAAADRHMAMFANSLFTRLSSVNPAVKYRFLRTGFEIVGDHKRAREARKVFDYYNDLVTEIKLNTVIDGSDNIGHEQPFGVFVNIRHTREIERESGGFSRYLQNQNNMTYSYNYGRPKENYREKFENGVREALSEQFDVISVTFSKEDVTSEATDEYGWRVTPYAYLLLKSNGPEVDSIPSVHLDLDFLDTSGYAVIPIETSAVPVVSKSKSGDSRPAENVRITQILDERQAEEGRLIIEVKATALGLVPRLDELLKIESPGFEVANVDDNGVAVSQFDVEGTETAVVSERNWMVTLQGEDGLKKLPTELQFGQPLIATANTEYQRYVDADLSSVEQVVQLEEQYGQTASHWPWYLGGVVTLILVVIAIIYQTTRPTTQIATNRFHVPSPATAFTVLGLLRNIESNNGLNSKSRDELVGTINRLEEFYFLNENEQANEPELAGIARDWVNRATS